LAAPNVMLVLLLRSLVLWPNQQLSAVSNIVLLLLRQCCMSWSQADKYSFSDACRVPKHQLSVGVPHRVRVAPSVLSVVAPSSACRLVFSVVFMFYAPVG
jgi:hypothetical protein